MRKDELNGGIGILAATFEQARRDFFIPEKPLDKVASIVYFASKTYKRHLENVGLPSDYLPLAIRRNELQVTPAEFNEYCLQVSKQRGIDYQAAFMSIAVDCPSLIVSLHAQIRHNARRKTHVNSL